MDGWTLYLVLSVVLFALSFLSGMMGLGVAFIATPVLAMFGFELKHEIMPLSLWLNGVTAISGAVTFARKKMVDWRTAIPLLVVTTIAAPVGVWLLQYTPTDVLWWLYVAVLLFLAYRMAFPPAQDDSLPPVISDRTRWKAAGASSGIGVFAGLLGVGPGFLMMPTLVLLGWAARTAAATNSVIVTPPVVLGVPHPPARGTLRLDAPDPDHDHLDRRRPAGRPVHGQARQEPHPDPDLRRRSRPARRAASHRTARLS